MLLRVRSNVGVWRVDGLEGHYTTPALHNGLLYVANNAANLSCVDAETGKLIWKQTVPGGWVWGSAAVDEGLVYVPTVNGHAVCLDANTGKPLWIYRFGQRVEESTLCIYRDKVFILAGDGYVHALK